jgi:serine/threonine protein phosphatase PrpC
MKHETQTTLTGHQDIGPRAEQQDAFGIWDTYETNSLRIAAVCDGAGGHAAGAEASATLRQTIKEAIPSLHAKLSHGKMYRILKDIVYRAHSRILEEGRLSPEKKGMASTLILTVIQDNWAHVIWVGDSRAYLLRDGKLSRLTRDHSQVEEFCIWGLIKRSFARLHPLKNVITRALGGSDSTPEGTCISLRNGDGLLLASDGIMDALSDGMIEGVLNGDHPDMAKAVVQTAVDFGTQDNSTAVFYLHPEEHDDTASDFYVYQVAQLSLHEEEKEEPEKNADEATEIQESSPEESVEEPANSPAAEKPEPSDDVSVPEPQHPWGIDIFGSCDHRESHRFAMDKVMIGREKHATITLADDPYLDREHVRIERNGEEFVVTDLDSRNGVYLKLDGPITLKGGFEVIAGSHRLVVTQPQTQGENHDLS